MNPATRLTKQGIYGVVFLFVVGSLGYLGFRAIVPYKVPPTPTPTPTIIRFEVLSSVLLAACRNTYDFVAQVRNPNRDFGSSKIDYTVTYIGAAGTVGTQDGTFYIMPGQKKYIVELSQTFGASVTNASMAIRAIEWRQLSPLAPSGVDLQVKQPIYNQLNQTGVFSRVTGEIFNNSNFDIDHIEVIAVPVDAAGTPLSANTTVIRTFLTRTTRGFEMVWPTAFSGTIDHIDVEAGANIFDDDNFLRTYGGESKSTEKYF